MENTYDIDLSNPLESEKPSAQQYEKPKKYRWWAVGNVILLVSILLAASHIHAETLGDSRVTVYRFAGMNGSESCRHLFMEEALSQYPGEELNVDTDYLGRSLTKKLDYYVVRIERGDVYIACFAADPINTADPPFILWDTAVESKNAFR